MPECLSTWATGHAVRTVFESVGTIKGEVIALFSDSPLVRGETLVNLTAKRAIDAATTGLAARVPRLKGYGRISAGGSGQGSGIVEEADASEAQCAVTEISFGLADGRKLQAAMWQDQLPSVDKGAIR